MSQFLSLTAAGIATYGCVYALAAMGLVVTYTTAGIFNFAHGAIGMVGAFLYWQFTQQWGWNELLALFLVVVVIAPLLGATLEKVVILAHSIQSSHVVEGREWQLLQCVSAYCPNG
jgi:branched-chain amino acid transport system permease protein